MALVESIEVGGVRYPAVAIVNAAAAFTAAIGSIFVTPQMAPSAPADAVDGDWAEAFEWAADSEFAVIVPERDDPYVKNSTTDVSGLFIGLGKPVIQVDASVLNPGNIGRNGFNLLSGTHFENFTINVTVTAFQTTPDGNFQGGVNIGTYRLGAGQLDTLKENIIVRNVHVHGAGPLNAHGLHIYGWVERCLIENFTVDGQVNFAISAHWAGDFGPDDDTGLATKSWHPAYITFRSCHTKNVNTNENGFRVAAGAFITFEECTTASQDAFETFAGDLGGQLAQNILPADNLAGIAYLYCGKTGVGNYCFQVSGNGGAGGVGRDIWTGNDHQNNSSLLILGCRGVMPAADTVLPGIVCSFVDQVVVSDTTIVARQASGTSYAAQFNACNRVIVRGSKLVSRNGVRLRAIEDALLDGNLIETDPKIVDTSVIGVSVEAHTFTAALASNLGIGDTTIYFTTMSNLVCPGSQITYQSNKIEVDGSCSIEDVPTLAWSLAEPSYAIGSRVTHGGAKYVSILAHVPSATSEPNVGATWATYWVVWPGVALHIQPSPIAITAGETVTFSVRVRKFNMRGGAVRGYRFALQCAGVASSTLPFVGVDNVTFQRNGIYTIELDYVVGGHVSRCFFDDNGKTTSSTDTREIYIQATSGFLNITDNVFGDNNFVKYAIYKALNCLGGVVVSGNKIKSVHPTTAGAAAIFWGARAASKRPDVLHNNFIDPSILLPITPTTGEWCHYLGDRVICSVSSLPVDGTWLDGDEFWLRNAAASTSPGSINTVDGTLGTLTAITGAITSGTTALVVNDATNIYPGARIAIAGVTGTKRVLKVVGTAVTIDVVADATVGPTAAVTYVAASLKAMPALAA